LHTVANDENDFIDALRVSEAFPSVGDDGFAGDFEKGFVDVRPMRVLLPRRRL